MSSRFLSVYMFAVIASLLLSFFAAYHETVINSDAICYLLSAQVVGESGVRAAMQLCGQAQWPFFSVLIYGLHQLTHLDFMLTAYILDSIFTVISVLAFILIVKELGGRDVVLWLAAVTILLSHEFNSVRDYIVRDHGFWAFYLTSILLLLRYFKHPTLKAGMLWGVSLLIATLFRIEGAFFLLAIPFVSWFGRSDTWRQRCMHFFTLNICLISVSMVLGLWLLVHHATTVTHLGRFHEIGLQLQHGFSMMLERYQATKAALVQYVLHAEGANQAGLVFIFTLIAWYLVCVVDNLSFIYALLVVYAWIKKPPTHNSNKPLGIFIIIFYVLVNVMITFGFLAERMFLSKRYLLALSLTLMVWVPFALFHLIKAAMLARRWRICLYAVVCLVFISALGGIVDFGYSKSYVRDAGKWLAVHVPANATLYANDIQLKYYSKHFGKDVFREQLLIAPREKRRYDYMAFRLNKNAKGEMAAFLSLIPVPPVQTFSNKRGDRVVIYQLNTETIP